MLQSVAVLVTEDWDLLSADIQFQIIEHNESMAYTGTSKTIVGLPNDGFKFIAINHLRAAGEIVLVVPDRRYQAEWISQIIGVKANQIRVIIVKESWQFLAKKRLPQKQQSLFNCHCAAIALSQSAVAVHTGENDRLIKFSVAFAKERGMEVQELESKFYPSEIECTNT